MTIPGRVGRQPGTGTRILVVDDTPSGRYVTGRVLRAAGFDVTEAATGSEALERAPGVDLVVLDVNLPDINGFEVCRRLKADPTTAIPVLHLSATYVRPQDRTAGLDGGADGYLTSPADPAELVATVHALLRMRRAEEAVRESETRFRATFDNAPVGIAHVAPDGRFLMVNRTFCAITGYTKEEMQSLTFQDITHPDDLDEDLTNARRVLAGKIDSYSMEKRYARKDGASIWVTLTVSLLRDERGAPQYFIAVVEDSSVRRRLEDELRHSQKMEAVGRLAGGVAHDFNNVLTAIAGYSDLLLEGMGPEDVRRSDLEEIRIATERAASLTRQLLAFSRRQVLAPVVLDLNETVTGMERMLRRLIGEDIALVTDLAPDLGPVRADAGQIEQVVLNLAVNSRDAMPDGGRLLIETRHIQLPADVGSQPADLPAGAYIGLTVADSGEGMDEATLSRVFEPFFTTKESGRGTGLGLATVYGIVTQSGGAITLQSEVGTGTRVEVLLPCVEESAAAEEVPATATPSGGRETILLAEDDEALRNLARRVLVRAGYTVLEAPNGRAALELATSHAGHIDLLVSDMVMPHLSGRELARRLLEHRPSTGVVLMSGYTEEVVTSEDLGRDITFLAKPFPPALLLKAVRTALESGTRT